MTKHTPGPWVAYGLESRSPYVCADEGRQWGNQEICNLFNDVTPVDSVSGQWLEPLPNAAANARLIAAAPELLDALTALMKRAASDAETYTADDSAPIWAFISDAADAIAKARGE